MGGQISTTLDNVTERGVACEFFSNQSELADYLKILSNQHKNKQIS